MTTTVVDQVAAITGLNVTTGGAAAAYVYGDLLPAATTEADLTVRAALRASGDVRVVTAVTSEAEFTAAATAAATARAAAEAAASDTTVAKPVLICPGSAPIVANYPA